MDGLMNDSGYLGFRRVWGVPGALSPTYAISNHCGQHRSCWRALALELGAWDSKCDFFAIGLEISLKNANVQYRLR